VESLQEGGVGILISNEFGLPYLTKTEPITAVTMARIIGEINDAIEVPFGVNVLWDATASIDLAVATDAKFVREVFTGVYAGDFGLWNTNVGQTARHRLAVSGDDVRLLFNIVPEAANYLAGRDLASVTRSTVFNCVPDALCVSGLTAGAPTDNPVLKVVKDNAGEFRSSSTPESGPRPRSRACGRRCRDRRDGLEAISSRTLWMWPGSSSYGRRGACADAIRPRCRPPALGVDIGRRGRALATADGTVLARARRHGLLTSQRAMSP
jgi:hypothetical protein